MNHLANRFNTIFSFKFLLFTIVLTLIFFFFLDIYIFKASRSVSGYYFFFFNEVIDPLSDILNPLYFMIGSVLVLTIIKNYFKITKQPKKLLFLKRSLRQNSEVIFTSMDFYYNVFKHVLLSLICAGAVCHVFKYFLGVSRPKFFFLEAYDRNNFFNWEHKINALPSGHTQAAFSMAILFVLYVNRYYLIIFSLAFLMGVSRIFMSMHFPSDLILGAYVGVFIPTLIFKIYFFEKISSFNKDNIFTFSSLFKLIYLKRLV